MTNDTLTIGAGLGGLCLLNTAPCLRDTAFDAADSVGYGRLVPARPPRTSILRSAMEDVADMLYGKRRKQPIRVHLTAEQNAFEAVRVVTRQVKNDYRFLFSATIDEAWNVTVLDCDLQLHSVSPNVILHHLEQEVVNKRDYLPASTVGQIAVKMLKDWKALPLLDNGGAWFLPGPRIEDYRTFAGKLHGCGPRFNITTFEIASDPDTVMTVLDRLHAEVTAGMQEIMHDVMEAAGGMADRSITVRLDRANVFLEKVRTYERLLGKPLPDLTDAIEQVKQAVAVNRLLSVAV